jgi:hypothetical protein
MGCHEHFARSQAWTDIPLIDFAVMLVGNQDHDDISLLSRGSCRHDLKAVSLCFCAALAIRGETYDYIAAVIVHVEGMGMTLAAVADDGNTFRLHQFEVGV